MKIATQWFDTKRIDDRITLIFEPYVDPLIRCNIWHLRGRDRDLLVDSGTGVASLRTAPMKLFEKASAMVLTHAHFDHVGGAYEFDSRIIHGAEAPDLERPLLKPSLRISDFPRKFVKMLTDAGYAINGDELVSAYPFEGFDASQYSIRPTAATRLVRHGDVIDLGDRAFEVLHLPGHSPGSIGLWDSKSGTFFAGDAIYDGPLLDNLPGSNIDDYIRTMEAIRALPVTAVHAGHEPSFGRARMIELVDAYLKMRSAKAS